jgi:hypothetical protein
MQQTCAGQGPRVLFHLEYLSDHCHRSVCLTRCCTCAVTIRYVLVHTRTVLVNIEHLHGGDNASRSSISSRLQGHGDRIKSIPEPSLLRLSILGSLLPEGRDGICSIGSSNAWARVCTEGRDVVLRVSLGPITSWRRRLGRGLGLGLGLGLSLSLSLSLSPKLRLRLGLCLRPLRSERGLPYRLPCRNILG